MLCIAKSLRDLEVSIIISRASFSSISPAPTTWEVSIPPLLFLPTEPGAPVRSLNPDSIAVVNSENTLRR